MMTENELKTLNDRHLVCEEAIWRAFELRDDHGDDKYDGCWAENENERNNASDRTITTHDARPSRHREITGKITESADGGVLRWIRVRGLLRGSAGMPVTSGYYCRY